jgi:hypothetical protein
MIKPALLLPPVISPDFRYPQALSDYCETADEHDLHPWYVMTDPEEASDWLEIVREQYPNRNLIPFARNEDTGDDIACFDGADTTGEPKIHFVHTFSDPDWSDFGYVLNIPEFLADVRDHNAKHLRDLAEDAEAAKAEGAPPIEHSPYGWQNVLLIGRPKESDRDLPPTAFAGHRRRWD